MVMFASYGFLHGGLVHLLGNMITLVSLGRRIGTEAVSKETVGQSPARPLISP